MVHGPHMHSRQFLSPDYTKKAGFGESNKVFTNQDKQFIWQYIFSGGGHYTLHPIQLIFEIYNRKIVSPHMHLYKFVGGRETIHHNQTTHSNAVVPHYNVKNNKAVD